MVGTDVTITIKLSKGPATVWVVDAGVTVGARYCFAINVEVLRAKDTEAPVASTRTVDELPGPRPRALTNNAPYAASKLDIIALISASLMVTDVPNGLYGCIPSAGAWGVKCLGRTSNMAIFTTP